MNDSESLKGVMIPEAFREPDWVSETYNKFEKIIREDYIKHKKISPTLVRETIKEVLLDDKLTPSWPLNKKNVGKLIEKMYDVFDNEEFQYRYYFIYRAGFFLSTYVASSFTPESLELPEKFKPQKAKIIKEYKEKLEKAKNDSERDKATVWVEKAFQKLAHEVLNYFRDNNYPVSNFLDSGSKGSEDDLRKLLVAVGLSINAKGEINDVIDRSGAEGLSPTQFFNYTSQAIVSQYKKSNETAKPGYLIRQLNTISAGVVLSKLTDCGTKRYLSIKILNKEMLESFTGKMRRTDFSSNIETEITMSDTDLIGEVVHIRSPLFCKAEDGICETCYNPSFVEKMHLTETSGIGLLASTSTAVLLTNMTLKAAHAGLSLNKEEVNFIEDVFEFSE
jgi:DNA-directed RNA polymerase subunit beta'